MKVMMINPPISCSFVPPLSLPCLTAYLRGAGIRVKQVDASMEAYHYLLTPGRVMDGIAAGREIIKQGSAGNNLFERVQRFSRMLYFNIDKIDSQYIDKIKKTITEVWHEGGFVINSDDFERQFNLINEALILSTLANFPNILTTASCGPGIYLLFPLDEQKSPYSVFYGGGERIYSRDPFSGYYRDVLIPQIKDFQPDLIGISYSYSQQTFHGLSLTHEIRESGISIPIVIGGSDFSNCCRTLTAGKPGTMPFEIENTFSGARPVKFTPLNIVAAYLCSGVQFGIQGEGEAAFLELCRRFEAGESCRDVDSLVYCDRKSNTLVFNKPAPLLPGDQLPALDLEGLPIGKKYLAPLPMAPIYSSRGCYWRKCAFCDHSMTLDNRFREVKPETIIETLVSFREKYGTRIVQFCDEAISPSMLGKLSLEIPRAKLDIIYRVIARFEKQFVELIEPAAKAGFKLLSFGLESGSPRVVSLMNKGYTHDTAQAIIDECYRSGVFFQCFTMFGFPTETHEELQETVAFLEKNSDKIALILTAVWHLSPGSPIEQDLERYGIIPTSENPVCCWDPGSYTLKQGINRAEVVRIYREFFRHPTLGKKVVSDQVLTDNYYMKIAINLLSSLVKE